MIKLTSFRQVFDVILNSPPLVHVFYKNEPSASTRTTNTSEKKHCNVHGNFSYFSHQTICVHKHVWSRQSAGSWHVDQCLERSESYWKYFFGCPNPFDTAETELVECQCLTSSDVCGELVTSKARVNTGRVRTRTLSCSSPSGPLTRTTAATSTKLSCWTPSNRSTPTPTPRRWRECSASPTRTAIGRSLSKSSSRSWSSRRNRPRSLSELSRSKHSSSQHTIARWLFP